MNSSKPYIMRALYEWIVDNECTPHILVAINMPHVQVPEGYGENGQLVLNIAPSAVRNFCIDQSAIHFDARFGGVPQSVYIPAYAVLAFYAQENGQGMFFDIESSDVQATQETTSEQQERPDDEPPPSPPPGRPNLRVVR